MRCESIQKSTTANYQMESRDLQNELFTSGTTHLILVKDAQEKCIKFKDVTMHKYAMFVNYEGRSLLRS